MSPLARSHQTMMGAVVMVIAAVPLPGKDRFVYVRKRSTLIPLQEKE